MGAESEVLYMAIVGENMVVSLDYTLRLDDGSVVDSSEGNEPLEFIQGQGSIIPGLEKALYGMNIGDEKDVVVAPAEAYGEFNSELLESMPRSIFPADMELEEGMGLRMRTPSGEQVVVYVDTIEEDEVIVDLNHPLAGETLHFSVKVVGVRPATADEVASGLQQGCGCAECEGECGDCGEDECGDGEGCSCGR
jgi:FKBP-type peptidyl-prolyl cis-trans isomerase SlyD